MMKRILTSMALLAIVTTALIAQPKKKPAPPAKKPAAAEAVPAAAAAAEAKKEPAPETKHFISEELMESLKNKRVLNDKDFEKKKVGGFFTGLPLINSDPNTGVGYGARVFFFNNGEKDDPLFRRTPYRQRFYAQFFQTTNGYSYHELNFDSPYIANSLYRIRGALVYEKNTWANFYGIGAQSLNALGTNFNTGKAFDKYSEYNETLREVDAQGKTNSAFNKYSYERPAVIVTLERDLFGGIVRPQFGIQVSKYNLRDLTGTQVQAKGGEGTSNQTLLNASSGQVTGYNGGFNNTMRAGVAIDTRDFEPDPNKGILLEAIAEVSNKAYGSDYNFARYTASGKFYYSPFPQFADVVIAGRAAYAQSVGDVPFYVMNQISSTENTSLGALGGLRSLRGYKDARFVANNMALANLELRWTTFDFNVLGQNFAPILVPFFDIGTPFDAPKDFASSVWRYSYGMGLRIAWNQATIIMVDYAMSKEDSNMFINFNHIF